MKSAASKAIVGRWAGLRPMAEWRRSSLEKASRVARAAVRWGAGVSVRQDSGSHRRADWYRGIGSV